MASVASSTAPPTAVVSSMYTLPLSATVGEAEYDVSASLGDLSRYLTSNANFWSMPATTEMTYDPQLAFQTSTSTPHTIASSAAKEDRRAPRGQRTFIHLSPPELTRTDPSPSSTQSINGPTVSKKRSREPDNSPDDLDDRVDRRQRNTEAARRYRQRKMDRVSELEAALAAISKERDEFKMKLARAEAEVDVLRGLMGSKS